MMHSQTDPNAAAATLPAAQAEALEALMQDGALMKAEALAQALAQAHPEAASPHRARGAVAAAQGAYGEAARHLAAALERAPADTGIRADLAAAMLRGGAGADGAQALKRAAAVGGAAMAPKDLLKEAKALCAACDPGAAKERLLEAIAAAPGDFEILEYYARLLAAYRVFETQEDGARALIRVLAHPHIETRGAERAAAASLERELGRSREAAARGKDAALAAWFTPLLIALLAHGLVVSSALEALLVEMRADLLRRVGSAPKLDQQSLDLAEAYARHGFLSEYLWPESAEETALVDALENQVTAALRAASPVSAAALFLLGAYRPLAEIQEVRDWVAAIAAQAPQALEPTLRRLVAEPLQEAALTGTLPTLTPVEDGVSEAVQAQYEANPYPRWSAISVRAAQPFIDHLAAQIAPNRPDLPPLDAPQVLVAGCGAGQHPISVALGYQRAQVVAVDLSRASLAYAARQAQALGLANIAFAQADILGLRGLDESFDIVEASGVLHHMADPEAGLARLTATLKPGGYFRIGLYSKAARRHITQARARIAELGYGSDLAGMRRFRADLIAGEMPEIVKLAGSPDFYAASNLRDLAFHAQEIQFDLIEIRAMLARHGLRFLGFACRTPQMIQDYAGAHPNDPAQTDLGAWAAFEAERPSTFAGMYQFWCRKI